MERGRKCGTKSWHSNNLFVKWTQTVLLLNTGHVMYTVAFMWMFWHVLHVLRPLLVVLGERVDLVALSLSHSVTESLSSMSMAWNHVGICSMHHIISFDRLMRITVIGQLREGRRGLWLQGTQKPLLLSALSLKAEFRVDRRVRLVRFLFSCTLFFAVLRQSCQNKLASHSQRRVSIWQLLQREPAALILLHWGQRLLNFFSSSSEYS